MAKTKPKKARKGKGGDLLLIVRAEEKAEKVIAKAEEHKKTSIRKELDEQVSRLHNFAKPKPKKISLKPLDPELGAYKKLAKKNSGKAVERILEDIHAST